MSRDLRPIYTAPTEAAKERFIEFTGKWGAQYPAITRLCQGTGPNRQGQGA
jgi:putative transposase